MIRDHRPYWLKRALGMFESWWTRRFVEPGFTSLGNAPMLMKPWNVKTCGGNIVAGDNLHIVTENHRKVSFSTWALQGHQGHITLGDNVLVCPGCRFDSASSITVGDDCMFAADAYVTDADWHDLYDRTLAPGATQPVLLESNVWVGAGSTLCKGVTIGRNSVIGAGSVVASDIPANVIAAGNPAAVIRSLDPDRALVTRAAIFADPAGLARRMDEVERYMLGRNSLLGWLRAMLFPRKGD